MNMYQGEKAPILFRGNGKSKASQLVYGQSSDLFSKIIRKNFAPNKEYTLVDFGSSGGEFLGELLKKLPEFRFKTIAIDKEKKSLDKNHAGYKRIRANLTNVPLEDNTADLLIMRYVLQWDLIENQEKILSELKRVMKNFAIIQHAGADAENARQWRKNNDHLFKGEIVALNMLEQYFSSSKEVEELMNNLGIEYERVNEVKIKGLSDIVIEKYALGEKESKKVKEIMGKYDYILITTWIIKK